MPYPRALNNNNNQKTIQPLFLAQANAFLYNTKSRCWTPLKSNQVPLSIIYDENRAIYRIISMDLSAEHSKKVLINSTILPGVEFLKTSSSFGHWTDRSTSKVYGIGFHSKLELDAFEDALKKAQSAIYTLKKESPNSYEPFQNCIYPSGVSYKNWNQLLNQVKRTHAKVPTLLIPEAAPVPAKSQMLPPPLTHRGQGEGPPITNTFSTKTFTVSPNQSAGDFGIIEESPVVYSEWEQARTENEKLNKVAVESLNNAKKWKVQIDTVQSDNEFLKQKLDESNAEVQELTRLEFEYKSALLKWQECNSKNSGKISEYKELEKKVQLLSEDKARMERRLHELRDEISKMHQKIITPDELVQLESYYKKMLDSAQKNLEEINAVNVEGKAVFQRIDYMLAKNIHKLIEIHSKINKIE